MPGNHVDTENSYWGNLRLFPLILSLVTWEKRLTPTMLQPPFEYLYRAIRSSLSLLFSRLNKPSPLSHSSYNLFSPSSLLFFGCAPAPQYLSCGEGPKTEHSEVWPHQCRVQGDYHCPAPAGHTIPDTSQDAFGLLGHLGTLLAYIQLAVNQHPQVLLLWAAFQSLLPKPVLLHGAIMTQVQDPALGLVECHTAGLSPLIVCPDPSAEPSYPQADQYPTRLGVICRLTEGALNPVIQIIDKVLNKTDPKTKPWRTSLVTYNQRDLAPFPTILWPQTFSQFFTQ